MNLCEFILHVGGIAVEAPDKYLRAGHNGPYHDPETPVRNFGHWLITFAKCYQWTGDRKFKDKVAQLAEYLCSEESRPHGYSFHHRDKPGKDNCNGLVGQAWTFEALAEASALLKDERYGQLAEEVFFQHPFDHTLGLWKRLEIDGQVLPFDATFNHQLWFAACSSLIRSKRNSDLSNMITRFLSCLKDNLTILNGGLIYHPIEHLLDADLRSKYGHSGRTKRVLANVLDAVRAGRMPERVESCGQVKAEIRKELVFKSVGYHSFNMYAFALLKRNTPTCPFWRSAQFRLAVDYMLTDEYKKELDDNKYGYSYNPPGFEVPFSLWILREMDQEELIEIASHWVTEQFRRCFNPETGKMDKNTEDPATHTARIYEFIRLPRTILERVEIDVHLR